MVSPDHAAPLTSTDRVGIGSLAAGDSFLTGTPTQAA